MFCGRWKHKTTTLFLFFKFANIWQTEPDEISVLSLKQRNSLFILSYAFVDVKLDWIGQSFRVVPNMVLSKVNIYEHQRKQTYDSYTFQPLMSLWYYYIKQELTNFNLCVFVSDAFFSLQDIQLVNFGHLIKDGELLIKVSDQPPKKRWEYKVKIFKSKFKSSVYYPFPLWGSVLCDNRVKTLYISNSN